MESLGNVRAQQGDVRNREKQSLAKPLCEEEVPARVPPFALSPAPQGTRRGQRQGRTLLQVHKSPLVR